MFDSLYNTSDSSLGSESTTGHSRDAGPKVGIHRTRYHASKKLYPGGNLTWPIYLLYMHVFVQWKETRSNPLVHAENMQNTLQRERGAHEKTGKTGGVVHLTIWYHPKVWHIQLKWHNGWSAFYFVLLKIVHFGVGFTVKKKKKVWQTISVNK